MIRALVTGVGGPAGVAVLRSLHRRPDVEVLAADMDGWAAGLYLVPPGNRRLVLPGAADGFVDDVLACCAADRVDVLVSTVDAELVPLATRRDELLAGGTVLVAPSLGTIRLCLDKAALAERCAPLLRVPTTVVLDAAAAELDWRFPVIVKPRTGSGSRGVHLVPDRDALRVLGTDDSVLVQELLPGEEYSVDVLADAEGRVVAAVPRTRARVDSGVAIAGTTVRDPALEQTATAVAEAIGLVGVANVQLRRDVAGTPALLEVNPRFPGALPLTVAAGVDMPSLALDLALGRPLPARLEFRELADVRYLEDVFCDPAEILRSPHAAHQGDL
ncbi:MAG TPA: ATP-grasp domain-containing protein [Cellulomonas sp.]